MRHRLVRVLFSCALVLGAVGGTAQASPGHGAPVARTETGVVRGAESGNVDSFLGVPYARPPVGEARWQPPRPPARWAGVRDAVAYGNRCPAAASTNGPRSETEDCLFLNVQRPAGAHPGQRLPVYFWIHGGALPNGRSNPHDGPVFPRNTAIGAVPRTYPPAPLRFPG